MKRLISALFFGVLLFTTVPSLFAQGTTAFTYQGRLNDSGSPAGGNYDMVFLLYGGPSGGSSIGPLITNAPTFVTNGLFSVNLNFSNNFDGSARYLEIRIRQFGDVGAYTTLTTRQQITPTPYALFASSSSNSASATTLTGSVPSGGISGGYTNTVNFTNIANVFNGFYTGNGAGLTNVPGGFLTWRIFDNTNLLALANTGYILTSSNFVTVTLPSSTNISDLLRITDVGAGGWKVLCGPNQNIFVNDLVGSVGANWSTVASSSSWFSIAASTDGSRLLAVDGGNAFISVDSGNTWNLSHSGPAWISAASSSDGSHLVAGESGSSGQVWTSSDSGATWIARLSSPPNNWTSIASSADGSRLAACSYAGLILTSTNYGTNWDSHTSSSGSRNWFSIASSSDGTKLVACVTNGNIFTSINGGVNWTSRATVQPWHGVASSSDGTRLAACTYGGQLYTSIDSGVTWTPRDSSRNWSSIDASSDGSKLVATVFKGGIYTSGDSGNTWGTRSPVTNWWTVASSGDGTIVCAGARSGNIYITTPSLNVTTTNYITGAQGSSVELLSGGLGQWIPISFMGQIFAY